MTKAPSKTASAKPAKTAKTDDKAGDVKVDDTKAGTAKAGAKTAKAKAVSADTTPEGKKPPAKGKKIEKPEAGHKPNALQQPYKPSDELAEIVGTGPFPRGEVVSKVWEYIKANKLQSAEDGRNINADDKLGAVFGKKQATMFEMNKLLSAHLSKAE